MTMTTTTASVPFMAEPHFQDFPVDIFELPGRQSSPRGPRTRILGMLCPLRSDLSVEKIRWCDDGEEKKQKEGKKEHVQAISETF